MKPRMPLTMVLMCMTVAFSTALPWATSGVADEAAEPHDDFLVHERHDRQERRKGNERLVERLAVLRHPAGVYPAGAHAAW